MKLFLDEAKRINNYSFFKKKYDYILLTILVLSLFSYKFIAVYGILSAIGYKALLPVMVYKLLIYKYLFVANIAVCAYYCKDKRLLITKNEYNKPSIKQYYKLKVVNAALLYVYLFVANMVISTIFSFILISSK